MGFVTSSSEDRNTLLTMETSDGECMGIVPATLHSTLRSLGE